MWKLVAFLLISGILIFISRASLRVRGSHGFFRFFAWEYIVLLFLLNIDYWFTNPFSWNQIISWILLCISFIPLVLGVKLLIQRGKPSKQREGEMHLLTFENTTQLVTTGIYHYIRHPLYSSLLLLAWGIFFKHPSWVGSVLVALATLSLYMTARADEKECLIFFGKAYKTYMQSTRRFIPWLF